MTQSKTKRIIAILLAVIAVVLIVTGAINLPNRSGEAGSKNLRALRIRTILNATGEGVVESYVAIAKKEATAAAKAAGGGMSAIRDAVAKAEEETRAKYSNTSVDYSTIDTEALEAAVSVYGYALKAYEDSKAAAEKAYIDAHYEEAKAAMEADREAKLAAGMEVSDNETVTVDMSGFKATAEMDALLVKADEAYLELGEALKGIYPVMDDDALTKLKGTIAAITYQAGDDFTTQYDRYMEAGSGSAVENGFSIFLIRYADDLIYFGAALIVAALAVLFSELLIAKLGIPR
ncbi:MAG: hypothetical protein Q4A66_12170, partial [Eubacteriales bacterium]|nr:hypothetical protein [Eubacteriales bacterium]